MHFSESHSDLALNSHIEKIPTVAQNAAHTYCAGTSNPAQRALDTIITFLLLACCLSLFKGAAVHSPPQHHESLLVYPTEMAPRLHSKCLTMHHAWQSLQRERERERERERDNRCLGAPCQPNAK